MLMRLGLVSVVGLTLLLGPALAEEPIFNAVERVFGASNVNAISGHGRATIGVSRDGELTVLTWPNPSYIDQLGYMTSNAVQARTLPRYGAAESAGLVHGIAFENEDGTIDVYWLRRDKDWTVEQDYGPNHGANIHTRYASAKLDFKVTIIHGVAPQPATDADGQGDGILIRFTVERGANAPTGQAWLMSYANFSPMPPNFRVPALPVTDWGLDGRNDFAAIYDDAQARMMHFHPNDQGIITAITELLSPRVVDYQGWAEAATRPTTADERATYLADIDSTFNPGAYVVWTSVPTPDAFQVGRDATDFCGLIDEILDNIADTAKAYPHLTIGIDPNLIDVVRCSADDRTATEGADESDAWLDAADGELSGRGLSTGETNGALRTPLLFADGIANVDIIIGLGPTATTAQQATTNTIAQRDDLLQAANEAMETWVKPLRLPTGQSERVQQVARRSLINLRVGTDAASGAIVASITRQPAYGLDWPRDGAFFNIALDIAGDHALAAKRAALYDRWQRKRPAMPALFFDMAIPEDPDTGQATSFPAGAWEMNYFADGMPGGFYRFEIDNVGFALWMMIVHAGWHTTPKAYLQSHWDAIKMAADLLTRWKDPETGLHAPAQEDDQAEFTQTLHGAITTLGALDVAARAAELLGEKGDATRWASRARELQTAIVREIWDPDTRRFSSHSKSAWNPGSTAGGPTAWSVWPFPLFAYDDPKIARQLELDFEFIRPALDLSADGGAYFMKNTVALAVAWQNHPEFGEAVKKLGDQLADQATPGTHHFGETMTVVTDQQGVRRARQQVSTPHLWEGILFYLTVMALDEPEALTAFDAILPPSTLAAYSAELDPELPAGTETGNVSMTHDDSEHGGCSGCHLSTDDRQSSLVAKLGLLFILGIGKQYRRLVSHTKRHRTS
ncbi:MAG: glycoside hydrolase family 15 protein [Myxococcota bacterium]|nr:glycoside hydrolase family 15 protein [Myxococcota bacterium]